MRLPAVVLLSTLSLQIQGAPPPPRPAPQVAGQPPRDVVRQPEPTGTGVIRGRVVAGDTGSPIRRGSVTLIPTAPPPPPPPAGTPPGMTTTVTTTMTMMNGVPVQIGNVNVIRSRQMTTDSQGAFEFTGLPAGTYRLMASAGQYAAVYLGIAFGAKRPSAPGSSDLGQPIELTNGQTFDKAVIALPRGSVLTGRVTDENGEALARVQVYGIFFQSGSSRGQRNGSNAQTDDLGQFRLYGLPPGEYEVVAEARGPTFVQPNAPPETEEDKIGFMTTYYPGTADEAAAQHVRTRVGGETPGIEIRMVTGRLFHVSGMVTDSQGRAVRASGQMMRRTPGNSGTQSFGFSTDPQGMFQMRSISPGNYRLIIRQQQRAPGGMLDGAPNDPGEMASMPLTIATDLENLLVTTSPGVTISGQIVFEQGPPQPMSPQMRVSASMGDPAGAMGMPTPQALITPDLTFTMKGMMGEYLLRSSAQGQYLKAVMVGAEDITDTPREFKTGDRVTLVMTSRASTLEGTVTDAKGQPSTDAGIIIFSEDKASWRSNSFRTRRAGVDQTGHYKLGGLMAGRYFIAAVPRERLNVQSLGADTAFFEELSKDATSLVIGEDETRQVDLKVVTSSGGQ